MENDNSKSKKIIETLPNGFARHQVVLDDQGNPTDYTFLEVNAAFEEMTGLKRENILGKKVTEVLPGIENGEFDWIDIYGKIALEGKSLHFEQYSKPLQRWYEVQAYSDEMGFFTTVFNEITTRQEELASMRNLLGLTEKLFSTDLATFDYQSAADNLLKLSGAKFAAINTYEEDRAKTVTRAISGMPSMIEQVSKILGFEISGQAWDVMPERLRKIEGGKLIRFSSLYETAMGSLNKTTSTMLHKLTGIGDIYVIELAYGEHETLGDIIFFMPKNRNIENCEAIELFSRQLGSLLARLRSEQAYQQKSEELDRYFNNSLDLLCVANTAGEFVRVNKSWQEILGYSAAELEGHPFLDFVHPDDIENTIEAMNSLDAQIELFSFKNRYLCSDGSYRWIEWRSKPQGNIIYAVARDVTATMKAEEELRESENRFNLAISGTGAGLWDWDMVNDEVFFSAHWKTMLGYADHEIENAFSGWQKLWHPEDADKINKAVQDHLDGKTEKYEVEHRLLHKDGSYRHILTRGDLIKDDKGNPVRWVGTNLDLTHIKKMEEELSERLAFEILVSKISSTFVNISLEELDNGICETLKAVGLYFWADRSYLYRFSEDGKTYTNTHNWCAAGIEAYEEKDQNRAVEPESCWDSELLKGNTVIINDVEAMPPELEADKQDFQFEEIKSLLTIPLAWDGKVFGCFGLDHVREKHTWTDDQVDLLKVIAELIAGAIARYDADRQIRKLSFNDQLTGLYNRRYFENEMERLDKSREHPIAVISADLDGLKLVNDTLGHIEGDRYLQAGAELLKSSLRASDILARVGGDEFALLLPCSDKAEAGMLMNRIRRQVEDYNHAQMGLPLSVSIGLAISESPDYPLEETFRAADNNMYNDKLQRSKKARAEIVSSLLSSLFERGNLAEGEREQVQELSIRLGEALKLEESRMVDLELLSQVYDLGKVGLPDSLLHNAMLTKTEELTEAEREAIFRHPETGYRIASASPDLAGVSEMVLKHHENYDGSGYPLGLKGKDIPLENRILSIAIAFSAMTNPRPYAETLTPEDALAELQRCAGIQFDPQLVEIFIEMLKNYT